MPSSCPSWTLELKQFLKFSPLDLNQACKLACLLFVIREETSFCLKCSLLSQITAYSLSTIKIPRSKEEHVCLHSTWYFSNSQGVLITFISKRVYGIPKWWLWLISMTLVRKRIAAALLINIGFRNNSAASRSLVQERNR